jgi:hypothetical protein
MVLRMAAEGSSTDAVNFPDVAEPDHLGRKRPLVESDADHSWDVEAQALSQNLVVYIQG